MKVSEDIQLRADRMNRLAKAVRLIEDSELGSRKRRLIHLLIVSYSGLTAAQCSYVSEYSMKEAGRRAAKSAMRLIDSDWECRNIYDNAVNIIIKHDKNH